MKKVLKVLRIIALVVVIATFGLIFYNNAKTNGNFDSRFSSSKYSDYTPFYPGVYIGGSDLVPGSYDVIIRGLTLNGWVTKFENPENYYAHKNSHSQSLIKGSTGFHFAISDGEIIEFDISSVKEMKFKKVG